MTKYTPTTEEVRQAYVVDPENPFFNSTADKHFAEEFDRWIAEYTSEKQAEAWDEGFDAGEKDYAVHSLTGQWDTDCTPNPYRQGETE